MNQKQYIIMDHPYQEEGFHYLKLSCGQILSYHEQLKLLCHMDEQECADYCLLGYAFCCNEMGMEAFDALKGVNEREQVIRVINNWSGRWLLIWHDEIFMDTCGLLGCYYTESGILSSGIHCVNTVLGRKDKDIRIRHKFGLDFYPGPNTGYADIRRLMPSQTYQIPQKKLGKRGLFQNIPEFADEKERIEIFVSEFAILLHNMYKFYDGKITLALTAGYDSRMVMALLEYAGVPYATFTMDHSNISREDVEIPSQLAALTNCEYEFIPRSGKASRKRYKEFDRHCAYMAVDEDRNFYAYGQFDRPEKTAVIRSGIFECAGAAKVFKNFEKWDLKQYKKRFVNLRHRKDMSDSLNNWIAYMKEDEQSVQYVDRFYWEQRCGCWLSGVEQSLTVIENVDSFQIGNCSRLLSILMGFPSEERGTKEHQYKIIQKACPQLVSVPFGGGKGHPYHSVQEVKYKKDMRYIYYCITCLDGKGKWKEAARGVKRLIKK